MAIERQKKVKTPLVILIVIWETETNPHSDVHNPPHVLPTSNALVCHPWLPLQDYACRPSHSHEFWWFF
ncbi:hypothetical protein E2C01_059417 [Portunus trituberculatus]|uniref:Uncharacterized protein n=1 Tax=Portunus trituberculatus TaxID=210409 RepID=A0A5B7H903_PORTR|nr:hypothetical protein [Portunus trituberculatus]